MNTEILNTYKIKFGFSVSYRPLVQQVEVNDISFCLCAFLSLMPYVNYLKDEMIVEMDKVLAGQSLNYEIDGETVSLEVRNVNSTFTYVGYSSRTVLIPTRDLKGIILSWIDFLVTNNIIV